MKIKLYIITIGLFFSGCSDFLEIDPPYTQDAENFFERQEDYERALVGAYDLLQGSFLNIWIGEIASDNAIAGGESVTDTEGLHEIENMSHDAVNNELRSIWRWNYAGLTRANYILEFKDKIDFEGKDQIIAECQFLRAYYYFQLVKFFGDVPLILDKRLGAEEAKEIERTSKSEVYRQIESDLKAAAAVLPEVQVIKGKVTKGAARSLLGKVQLYQNKFDQAASTLDSVIQSSMYSLINDYSQLFSVANEGHSETVFDIEYSGLEGGSYGCFICLEGNVAPGFQGIRQYNGPVYGDGNSYNLPTQDLYDFFDANDPRKDATVLNLDEFISKQANPDQIEYAKGAGGHTGFYNNKYIKKQGEIGLPDNDLTSPVNYKVIRYADVLLMAAEAHNRKSSPNDAKALEYLNLVRTRVGMPSISSNGSNLTEDIWNERRSELSGEGLRFFDLVRTGKASTEIDNFVPGKHELFPIPQVEIDLAGGNWSQNPNY
ncbi:MAG: RagB/SusD family nutrient uptake outer membrane protein [Bacteroidetes bacterium MED-G17]|nr:MAG: RagB/SusD family nutrient uptake outer membrane protein [Bacteroidetes bacterium MED-G17]|tara:strand:- start:3859 stop:5325 length:1467 start_codon:yes stop_codon:yes gene_type:complete